MFNNPFTSSPSKKFLINPKAEIVFVSDMFADDYVGGAELTTQALIDACPFSWDRVRSRDISMETLESGHDKFWIFGNFAALNQDLIPSIVANLNYSVLEYDYKYCRYRSPEKHLAAEQQDCNCSNEMHGKLISTFLCAAKHVWWMSEKQQEIYQKLFPFLRDTRNTVLSSVFDDNFFATIDQLRIKYAESERTKWIVLGSPSWIKGTAAAEQWCQENGKDYEVVWNLPYQQMLEKLAQSKGLAFLPNGSDTCPRIVIEAKLLGCELHINDYVQHKDEEWFNAPLEEIQDYLVASPSMFWRTIKNSISLLTPTISGYTQTRNCIEQDYPWEQSVQSMLGFCNEVVVVDGGSTDGTWERLQELASNDDRIKPHQIVRNWNDKRFALYDGQQKAEARKLCVGDFCWQSDIDEVVHEDDYEKIKELVRRFPKDADLITLPVIEYWGGPEKVRVDVNPWKWRLSRNDARITHGLPKDHMRYDEDGSVYSAGSDGTDYIYTDTMETVPCATFYTDDVEAARMAALSGNANALAAYENWLNRVAENIPGVYHYSWYNLERKIHTYKNYWSKHWTSLYNQIQDDVPDNNKFFDKSWSQVSDEDIKNLAIRMKSEMGGWIFHRRIDLNKPTPFLSIRKSEPAIMKTYHI